MRVSAPAMPLQEWHEALQLVCSACCEQTGAMRGAVWLPDESSKELRRLKMIDLARGVGPGTGGAGAPVPGGTGQPGAVGGPSSPGVAGNRKSGGSFRLATRANFGEGPVGQCFVRNSPVFTPDDAADGASALQLGKDVSEARPNMGLLKHLRGGSMRRMSVIEGGQGMPLRNMSVLKVAQGMPERTPIAVAEGGDGAKDAERSLCVPITNGFRVVAVMQLLGKPKPFDRHDAAFVSRFAVQGTVSLRLAAERKAADHFKTNGGLLLGAFSMCSSARPLPEKLMQLVQATRYAVHAAPRRSNPRRADGSGLCLAGTSRVVCPAPCSSMMPCEQVVVYELSGASRESELNLLAQAQGP